MSIVALTKVTLVGHSDDKERILSELQAFGCLHLIPLASPESAGAAEGPSSEARAALRFLLSSPQKRRQATASPEFSAVDVEHRALALEDRLRNLCDRRDFLAKRIADLKPWGDFDLGPLAALHPLKFWFYVVPHYQVREVRGSQSCWQVVNRDNRFAYVVVISAHEPENMPVPRTHTGSAPLRALEREAEQVASEIEEAEVERYRLTRWCRLFAQNLGFLEDRKALSLASRQVLDHQPLFGMQAWAPSDRLPELQAYAAAQGMLCNTAEPGPDDAPPTLMRNPEILAGGQDLVTFYMIPGYWTWDPSVVVLFSFALFFAMILSDAGYAALLGLIAWRYWGRMGGSETGQRLRVVFAMVVAASLIYGVLTGSYFGVGPPSDSVLAGFRLIDVHRHDMMMALCVVIGAGHVILGNLINLWRLRGSSAALVPLAWIAIVSGALSLGLGLHTQRPFAAWAGGSAMGLGALMAIAFAAPEAGWPMRPLKGLLTLLTKLSGAFGDVMSYLRLFALGLASASLAGAFNDMALNVKHALPGVGLLAFLLVLLIGHALNLVLGLMSAVVHGLRLNYIEFFNWSLPEEGTRFKPFKRRGGTPWMP